jgi:tetratricopeptide (TPR) repeat protein
VAAQGSVFLSHSSHDREWSRKLAGDLEQAGIDVFLDDWDISYGDRLVSRLNDGLRKASDGLIVWGLHTRESPWVRAEFDALLHQAIQNDKRLIVVILADVDLPPLLNTWVAVDFRGCRAEPDYRDRLSRLIRALRGERPMRDPVRPVPKVSPDQQLRLEGPQRVTIQVGAREVTVRAAPDEHGPRVAHQGPGDRVHEQLWKVARARRQAVAVARSAGRRLAGQAPQSDLIALGQALGEQFLPGPAAELLAAQLAVAEKRNAALRIALDVEADPRLQALPWETLCLPGSDQPLVLHPRSQLHRVVSGLGSTPAILIPEPLRILAAIGAPDTDGGEMLDYEAELDRIGRAVERARLDGRALVRALDWGTASAIRDALRAERFHILHISCQASAGALVLETADGRPDLVGIQRLATELLVPDRGVPLIVLAGSLTAIGSGDPDADGGDVPSLARELLSHGVPAVLAMAAEVSDRYAIQLASHFYQALARGPGTGDPLTALSDARREAERARQELRQQEPRHPDAALAEWWAPALYLRTDPYPLIDEAVPASPAPPSRSAATIAPAGAIGLGEFVGRRGDIRRLLQVLRGDQPAAIIYGIGGIGKTHLARRLVTAMRDETGIVVFNHGRKTPAEILHAAGLELGLTHPELGPLAAELRDREQGWRYKLAMLARVIGDVSVLIVLDEAEQNIADDSPAPDDGSPVPLADTELPAFIAEWVRLGPGARLLITSRQPLDLPRAAGRLTAHHLGPLSRAETDKLMWRLPALGALERPQRDQAYADVGGHPRALEYVDALLRGGRTPFSQIADRMEDALRARGITDPTAWLAGGAGKLDHAVAETVTLIVDDILVDRLLARLLSFPLARQLFVAASVFRAPVDANGLNWAVAETLEPAPDPDRTARIRWVYQQLESAQREGTGFILDDLKLPPELLAEVRQARDAGGQPSSRPGLEEAIKELLSLSLLSAAPGYDDANPHYLVHRWTARGLQALIRDDMAALVDTADLVQAHRRAADYHEWRATSRREALADLLEARHHWRESDEPERAAAVTLRACAIMFRWGEYQQIRQLCEQAIADVPEAGQLACELLHMQSKAEQALGQLGAAEALARDSLEIAEANSNARWEALGHEQLASVAAAGHDHQRARDAYGTALALAREAGEPVLEVRCYLGFGAVALALGNDDEATRFSEAARDYARMETYRQYTLLEGTPELAALAMAMGDRATADRLTAEDAERRRNAADLKSIIGRSWLQLGQLHLRRDDPERAAQAFREAMTVATDGHDWVLAKDTSLQVGRAWQRRQAYSNARRAYLDYIELADKMGDRLGIIDCYCLMGDLALTHHDPDRAAEWYEKARREAAGLGQKGLIARAHLRLAGVRVFRGDAAGSRRDFSRAESIGRDLGDPQTQIESLLGQARVELADGTPAARRVAEDALKRCRRIAAEHADQAGVTRCLVGLGVVDRLNSDFGDAERRFTEARDGAARLGNRALEAECVRELGATEQASGDAYAARSRYSEALRIAEDIGDAAMIAALCRQLGALAREELERYEWYDHAAGFLSVLGRAADSAMVCLEMARLIARSDRGQAILCCERALDLVDRDEQSLVTIRAQLERARCERLNGSWQAANDACDEALRLAEIQDRRALIAQACNEGGIVGQLAGDLDGAKELHSRALRLAEEEGDQEMILASCRDLGRLARRASGGQPAGDLESWYRRALELAEATKDEEAAAACAQQLALAARRAGADTVAEELARRWPVVWLPPGSGRAAEHPRDLGADAELAGRRRRLGANLTDDGRPDEAIWFIVGSLRAPDQQHVRDAAELLGRQRAILGPDVFAAQLASYLGRGVVDYLVTVAEGSQLP